MKVGHLSLFGLTLVAAAALLPLLAYLATFDMLTWLNAIVFRPPSYVADNIFGILTQKTEGAHKHALLLLSLGYVWLLLLSGAYMIGSLRKRVAHRDS